MSDREGETLANMAARTRGARGARLTSWGADNQSVERAPDAPATQADIAGICQVVAQLIQQQAQTTPRPTLWSHTTRDSEGSTHLYLRVNLILWL